MIKKYKNLFLGLAVFTLLVAPIFSVMAAAQSPTTPIPTADQVIISDVSDIPLVIDTLAGWLYGIVTATVVIFIIYAAYIFLTSGGDDEKVKEAKNYIIYSAIGVAVMVLARGIIALVVSFFSV